VDVCILCGCDYAGTIRGIGSGKVLSQTALSDPVTASARYRALSSAASTHAAAWFHGGTNFGRRTSSSRSTAAWRASSRPSTKTSTPCRIRTRTRRRGVCFEVRSLLSTTQDRTHRPAGSPASFSSFATRRTVVTSVVICYLKQDLAAAPPCYIPPTMQHSFQQHCRQHFTVILAVSKMLWQRSAQRQIVGLLRAAGIISALRSGANALWREATNDFGVALVQNRRSCGRMRSRR